MSNITDPVTTDEAIITYFQPLRRDVSVKAHHVEELLLSVVWSVKVNFLSYRYRADKSTIFGMRGL